MNPLTQVPAFDTLHPPALLLLEAEPGRGRWEQAESWLRQARSQGARTWHLSCDFDRDGPWAGLRELLGGLLPELRRDAPELITLHDYELLSVLPALRREWVVRHPTLTDSAPGDEKVRNYPMDRAFRIPHGLVDLLVDWHERSGSAPWVIACDAFDRAGALVRRFFLELIRRRGQRLQLTLLLCVDPGTGEALAGALPVGAASVQRVRLPLPAERPARLAPEEARQRAEVLMRRTGNDPIELELHLPTLLALWEQGGRADQLRRGLVSATALATRHGLYEDALRYGRRLLDELEVLEREDPTAWWISVDRLLNGYVAVREAPAALELALKMEARLREPERLFHIHYMLAMLHARFLPEVDLDSAEAYLEQGLVDLKAAHLPAEKHHFLHVFNRNALALVRVRQGRPLEAIALCQEGVERLDAHLAPGRHRLHRSVLQYNMAQVYAALGENERAVAQYSATLEMDPFYSEYHNERGIVLMRMGRLEEALADFRRAMELSPPYPEVRINLGQCLRLMGRMEEAFEAYGAALDLNPNWPLARIGRAQAAEVLERTEEAVADYTVALELEPAQPLVLANRASLLYAAGRGEAALADLEAALVLAPKLAELHRNRALVLAEQGRASEEAEELRTYLQLAPEAEDRGDVETRLQALRN